MKKSLVGLFLVGLAATILGQGSLSPRPARVGFRNSGITFYTPDDRLVYFGEVGGEKLVGTNYAASLYYARPGTTELLLVPGSVRLFREPTTTVPGSWNSAPSSAVSFPDVYGGEVVTLQIRVWDIQRFENWEAAIAGGGLHGESREFPYFAPFELPGFFPFEQCFYMHELRAFAVILEPSALGLCLLGAFGLWFSKWRR